MELYRIQKKVSGQFTTFDLKTKQKALLIGPGSLATLTDYEGSGIIEHIWFTVSGWFFQHWDRTAPVDASILKKLILRIHWDGNERPAVEAPIGDFFGIGHCEYRHFYSKYIGMSSGGLFCCFPMPFNAVRITVENLHDSMSSYVFMNANYSRSSQRQEETGRFHCQFSTGINDGHEPLTLLDSSGEGHYVGCSVSVQSRTPHNIAYLEAPEYIYIDGEETPSIFGTGMEDYFNGGWYFREGEFCGPTHGVPIKDPLRLMVSMYRLHENDAIYFGKSMRMGFLNPLDKQLLEPYWYSSTAYYYLCGQEKNTRKFPTVQELMSLYRMRDADHQSFP